MRTKKTNIKDSKITRTIKFTRVKYLSVNLETREVEEHYHVLVMEYTPKEAEEALRELGHNVAAILEVEIYEQVFEMRTSTFANLGRWVG